MKRRSLLLLLIAGGLALLPGLAGCSSGEPDGAGRLPTGQQFRADDQGNVTVDATWNLADDGTIVFDITLNTHSVPLDGYDLAELSLLRDGTGGVYRPVSWDAPAGDHHRRGNLAFPMPAVVTAGPGGGFIELVIRDVAGIPERILRWDL